MKNTVAILSLMFLLSCSDTPQLGAVDLGAFKSDRGGCKNLRQMEIDHLKEAKEQLLGKSENEVFKMLGRYDVQALDRRQTKIFIYYLEKGDHCTDMKIPGYARTMILRFNAVALVKEVSFKIGLP